MPADAPRWAPGGMPLIHEPYTTLATLEGTSEDLGEVQVVDDRQPLGCHPGPLLGPRGIRRQGAHAGLRLVAHAEHVGHGRHAALRPAGGPA